MRKIIIAAGIGLIVSMTAAAAPGEQSPEAKAYFSMSFGGAESSPQKLQYGLRLEHDRFFAPNGQALPPLMQLDFTRRGMGALSVNGRNVVRSAYRVNQDGDEEFEEDEEEGFFESIGSWFSGLFGDDEEEDEEEVAAAQDNGEKSAKDAPSEGYDLVDWGLLTVGLVGIGYVTAELIDGEDDGKPRPASTGTGGGALPPCGAPPAGPFPPNCDIPIVPVAFSAKAGGAADRVEHQEWLDEGTGQMGDLYARD